MTPPTPPSNPQHPLPIGVSPHLAPRLTPRLALCLTLLTTGSVGFSQTLPASTQPATATTTPAATLPVRPRLVIPPGFVRLDIDGHRLLIHPEDEAFIRGAITAAGAPKRPTTMPSDLLTRVKQSREELIKGLVTDLRSDEAATTKFIDTEFLPMLQEQVNAQLANVYAIATPDRYKQLGVAGWQNPGFYYNRLTGEAKISNTIIPVNDPDQIDSLIFLTINPTEPDVEKRKADLATKINLVDSKLLEIKATQGLSLTQLSLVKFIGDETLKKMVMTNDQNWWFMGVTSYVAAKYFAMASGLPYRGVMNSMMFEPQNAPIRAASLDLLSPPDPATIRPEAYMVLQSAIRRKSLRALDELLLRHGNDIVPQLIDIIDKEKPKDGQALVNLIKAKTGTDITPYLRLGTVPEK